MENAVISGYPIVLPAHRAAFHREHPLWHKAWLDSIHSHLKPDDVVIDVGAEQGDLSALVASWIPDGGMYLIEPVAGFWPTIRDTFSANGLTPPLSSAVAFAGEDVEPVATLYTGWPPETERAVNTDPGFQHSNERPDLPHFRLIDMFVDTDRPTALLVDVEGAELGVLLGAEIVLIRYRPMVWCAIHPEIMAQRYGHDPNDLLAYMRDLGYSWELLGFQGEIHVRFYPT